MDAFLQKGNKMSRLIDADAIKIKPEYMHDICGVIMTRVEDIARILNDMPTIKPEPHWIPNTPENVPKDPFGKQIQLANGWIITGWFDGEDWFSVPKIGFGLPFDNVLAWCELPEPYQPEPLFNNYIYNNYSDYPCQKCDLQTR